MCIIMLRTIFVFVLFCSLKQNNAFVIPNAEIAGFEAESLVSDHQLDKKSPQSFFPDFPFESTSTQNYNDAQLPFPANLPQFGMQFPTNGLQTGLSTDYIPFQSGNMIDPGGNGFRDLAQDMFNQPLPPNGVVTGTMQSMSQNGDQQPVFKTESFNMTPDGQQLYENGKLVENVTNQTPNMQGMNQEPSKVQNPIPQGGQGDTVTQPNTSNVQQAINPSTQSDQIPSHQGSQLQNPNNKGTPSYPNFSVQTQQPNNPGSQGQQSDQPKQSNPIVKVSSAGASSSTFVSSTNNQPPEMSQSAGAYNYNYDSTQPDPVKGSYMGVNGYTPNMYDPNQGNYQYTQGTFPNPQNIGGYFPSQQNMGGYFPSQQNMGGYSPGQQNMDGNSLNPLNPNYAGYQTTPQPSYQFPNQAGNQNFQQAPNQQKISKVNNPKFMQGFPQNVQNQQSNQPPLNNHQNVIPQGYPKQYGGIQFGSGNFPMMPDQISQQIGRLNNHLSSMGMPHVDPSAVMAPFTQLIQTFPNLMRNAANQGLQISKIPFDMSNAALDALNTDLGNVRVNEFVQIPTEVGRAVVNSIEEMINQFQRNLMMGQLVQQPTLARRSPEPWMIPNSDTSQMSQYFTSVPFTSAQEKLNNMKNDIFNKMSMPQMPQMPQMPSFNQMNPFNYFSQPQIPQMPKFPQPSANGEPVIKVSSSSVSESTHSSSVNGAPPEVSYQAEGSKYDYDSTKKDNPVQADVLAMGGYTPDASDPSKGKFVAFENAYP